MTIYRKLLRFLKPMWKFILLSIFLSVIYILFNSISLWVSVDFVQELFSPQVLSSVKAESNTAAGNNKTPAVEEKESIGNLFKMKRDVNVYKKINYAIKSAIIQKNRFDTLKMVCLIIFISFLLKNMVSYFRGVVNNYISMMFTINLRDMLYKTLLRLPLSFFEKRNTGQLTSIVFNDVYAVNTVLNNSFGKMILTPLQVFLNLAILIFISWKLSLITFLIVPVSGYLIIKIGQSIRRKSRRVFRQIANVVSQFQESISSIRIVKAFTNENRETERFQNANYKWYKLTFRANRLSYVTSPLNETLGSLILVVLLWYGGRMVYTNSGLEAEDFIRYLVFLFMTFEPLREFSNLNNVIQTGIAAAERIFNTMEEAPEVYEKPDSKFLETFHDAIVFQNVSFRYSPEDPYVLRDVHFQIAKGEMVAFVGPSGAGKSTLVDLIPRFYDVTEGKIAIDGVDIRDFSLTSLRNQIGIVTQELILFDDTIRFNIGYGLHGVSDDKIIEAAKAANAWEFIEKMENGLDTVVGERGVKLSGGQKQRISIARAILKNTPILILDEATSSLDTESEKLVQEAIDQLMQNRTVLVIAHRLSTVIHATKIVVIHDGEIVDIGPHRKLLKTCSLYRHLYEMQFRDQENP